MGLQAIYETRVFNRNVRPSPHRFLRRQPHRDSTPPRSHPAAPSVRPGPEPPSPPRPIDREGCQAPPKLPSNPSADDTPPATCRRPSRWQRHRGLLRGGRRPDERVARDQAGTGPGWNSHHGRDDGGHGRARAQGGHGVLPPPGEVQAAVQRTEVRGGRGRVRRRTGFVAGWWVYLSFRFKCVE